MRNWGLLILLMLAAGYAALGIYGKYRKFRDAYRDERGAGGR